MFFLIPYHVDVPMRCRPWMNWVLIAVTVVFFPLCVSGGNLTDLGKHLAAGGKGWTGYVGHVLVHADLFHLLGNMLFLWVFGNAVCAKVGNLLYPLIYLGLGLVSGVVSHLVHPQLAVGASGAINGVVGMFVVWYLLNDISCWYAYWFFTSGDTGTFSISSYWMILLWLVFDVWGVFGSDGMIDYVAHVAGFAAGFALAAGLLLTGLVTMDRGERSLLQVLSGTED